MIYDERAKMVLWDYIPNKSSQKDIIEAMNENLELTSHKEITKFSFSINNPYEKRNVFGLERLINNDVYKAIIGIYGQNIDKDKESKLKMLYNLSKKIRNLPTEGREEYLYYHREFVFKK